MKIKHLKIREKIKIFIFLSLMTSCQFINNPNRIQEDLWSDVLKPEIVLKHKIKFQIKTQIRTDDSKPYITWSNGQSISPNKVVSIKHFNSMGFCDLELIPNYVWRDNDTTGLYKLSFSEQFFFPKKVETNLPTGYYDSVFYTYGDNDLVIEEERRSTNNEGLSFQLYKIRNTFDDRGNLIQRCSISDDSFNNCSFKKYTFDSRGVILSVIDSNSVMLDRPDIPNKGFENKYTYKPDGLLESIGDTYFVYNLERKLVEKFTLSDKIKTDIEYYDYDMNGNCVKIEKISGDNISYDANGAISDIIYDTTFVFRQFEEGGLLIESSFKERNAKYSTLFKYSYRN
jgi:hypothetical protein